MLNLIQHLRQASTEQVERGSESSSEQRIGATLARDKD